MAANDQGPSTAEKRKNLQVRVRGDANISPEMNRDMEYRAKESTEDGSKEVCGTTLR